MEYISHEDYKKMMENFSKGTPKQSLNEAVEEGNAFTAGLAKAKKGEEFKVGNKTFKDRTNYDAPVKKESWRSDPTDEDGEEYVEMISDKLVNLFKAGKISDQQWRDADDYLGDNSYELWVDSQTGGDTIATILKHVGADIEEDASVNEYQFDQMYPDDPGPFEGKNVDKMIKEFLLKEDDVNWDRMDDEEAEENETDNGIEEDFSPDSSDFEQAIAKELQYLGDEELTDVEYEQALKALENPKVVDKLWGVHPKKAATALAKMVRGKEVGEGLNPAPFQATGPTIQTVEGKKNKFAHLTSEERDQLRQYVETIRTVKEQIKKMTEKSEMEEGGDMTNLVMKPTTMSEDGEVDAHEEIESKIDPKLHDTFHKVLEMVTKQLLDAGFEESQVGEFLKHEVSELPDFITRQYESK
jgi:hypothetical protein